MLLPKTVITIAIIAASIFLPRQAHAGRSESEMAYTQGREALKRNANAEALSLFKKSVEEDPSNCDARFYLGDLYGQNIATYDLAEEILLDLPTKAMSRGTGNRDDIIFRAGVSLGKIYAKSGRNGQSIRLIRNVIAAAPPSVHLDEAYTVLGVALYYERLYDDALFELRRAYKINPANTAATFNLKTIRTRLEHFNAARIYSRMGDHLGAIGEYRTAIALDPRFIDARYRLGIELLQNGDKAEAIKELRRAASVSEQYSKIGDIQFGIGLALRDLGQAQEAEKAFDQVVVSKPKFAPVRNEIGKLHMLRKDYKGAIRQFSEAIQLDPNEEYALNMQKALLKEMTSVK